MRVDVSPRHATAEPGRPVTLTVTVTNTTTIISGHRVRVLGIDPAWAAVTEGTLSLFPATSGTATVTVTLPHGIPAGRRTLEVEVRELTPPEAVSTVPVELSVPADTSLELAVDPPSVTAGRVARVAVLLTNSGSAETDAPLAGREDTGTVAFHFEPAAPSLVPGEQAIVAAHLRARRPWVGSPKIRPYRIEAGTPEAPVVAQGAWVQPPRFSRGNLALLGLLVAGTVFAAVISATLSQVVGQSNANRQLALQVAEAAQAKPASGSASIAGVVDLLTTGAPQSGVTVVLYHSGNVTSPVASTATDQTGAYHFSGLAAGSYDLGFDGAGFAQLWYPDAIAAADAQAVQLTAHQNATGIDIAIGGLPATISGQVTGANPTGAVLTLQLPTSEPVVTESAVPGASGSGGSSGAGAGSGGSAGGSTAGGETAAGTVVTTQTLSSDGTFDLTGIPSPATYQLVVTAAGDAPAVQEITLAGGEDRSGVTIELSPGDGAISGTVSGPSGPLGGATVSATAGSTTETTVSVTTAGSVGAFSLQNLPSPATVSLVVSASGYASQTLSVSLSADQRLTGLAVVLQPGQGTIGGVVTTPSGTPPGGVQVTVSSGSTTLTTMTSSVGQVGSYSVAGLAVPGTYTVTFSRSDLESQTEDVALTSAQPDQGAVDETLVADTASLSGTVTQSGGGGVAEVAVSLVSGSTTYQVTTAGSPTAGAYAIAGIAPGTYTLNFTESGGVPVSSIVTLTAGQSLQDSPVLSPPASITGEVVEAATGTPLAGAQVQLFVASQYPGTVTATTTTDDQGTFTFPDVAAPQSYLVAVAYPVGSAAQVTIAVTSVQGQSTPVCGSAATGSTSASSGSSTSGSSTSSTGCNPSTDPIQVTVS